MPNNFSLHTKEVVSVLCNDEGQPVAFIWRGAQYLVSSRPVRWYSRRCWWVDFNSAYHEGPASLEVEIWRLRGSSESDFGFFEIEHIQPEDEWRMVRVIDE